jgi:hypothetical protein
MAQVDQETCLPGETAMTRSLRDLVTVTPPSFDRTAFSWADRRLGTAHAPYDRSWLMARFDEGLQIRMLHPPEPGIVLFQPGRLSWRPIEGSGDAIVVHDLRVADGPDARARAGRLWHGVEHFARFYGFSSVLAPIGREEGLVSPGFAPGRGWIVLDEAPGGARLAARVLQGPVALPRFPVDWRARAAALGPGPVIQTSGESRRTEARARRICALAEDAGVTVRRDHLTTPDQARHRAVSPGATFSAVLDGTRIGGLDLSDTELVRALAGQRPS